MTSNRWIRWVRARTVSILIRGVFTSLVALCLMLASIAGPFAVVFLVVGGLVTVSWACIEVVVISRLQLQAKLAVQVPASSQIAAVVAL